jgi:hypothetical protein
MLVKGLPAHPLTDSRRSLTAICGHHSDGNQKSSQTAPKHVHFPHTLSSQSKSSQQEILSPASTKSSKSPALTFPFLSVALNALSIQFLARTSIDQYNCASSDSRGTVFQVANKLISHALY